MQLIFAVTLRTSFASCANTVFFTHRWFQFRVFCLLYHFILINRYPEAGRGAKVQLPNATRKKPEKVKMLAKLQLQKRI